MKLFSHHWHFFSFPPIVFGWQYLLMLYFQMKNLILIFVFCLKYMIYPFYCRCCIWTKFFTFSSIFWTFYFCDFESLQVSDYYLFVLLYPEIRFCHLQCTSTKALWWHNIMNCLMNVQKRVLGTALQIWLHMFGLPVSPIHKYHVWILIIIFLLVNWS